MHKRLYIPPSFWWKTGALHCKRVSKHPLFTTLSLRLTVGETCNISNKYDFLMTQLKKYFYLRHLTLLLYLNRNCTLHRTSSWKHSLFTTILLVFTVDKVCNISNKYQSPSNLPTHNTLILLSKRLYNLLSFEKNVGTLHWKHLPKHPLFTIFSLFLTLSEVCNVSNKYWLPYKSANKIFLHKTKKLVKISKNVVKSGCFQKLCNGEHNLFFEMK